MGLEIMCGEKCLDWLKCSFFHQYPCHWPNLDTREKVTQGRKPHHLLPPSHAINMVGNQAVAFNQQSTGEERAMCKKK